jgi:hypothetical protein
VLVVPADEMDFQHDMEARQLIVEGVRESLKPASIRYLKPPVKVS